MHSRTTSFDSLDSSEASSFLGFPNSVSTEDLASLRSIHQTLVAKADEYKQAKEKLEREFFDELTTRATLLRDEISRYREILRKAKLQDSIEDEATTLEITGVHDLAQLRKVVSELEYIHKEIHQEYTKALEEQTLSLIEQSEKLQSDINEQEKLKQADAEEKAQEVDQLREAVIHEQVAGIARLVAHDSIESAIHQAEVSDLQAQLEQSRSEAQKTARAKTKDLTTTTEESKEQEATQTEFHALIDELKKCIEIMGRDQQRLTYIKQLSVASKLLPQKTHWFKYVVAIAGAIVGGLLIASGVGAPIGIPVFTGGAIVASTFITGGGSFIGAKATYQNPTNEPKEASWRQYALAGTFFFIGIALTMTGIGSPIGIPLTASAVLGGTSLFAGSVLFGYTQAKQQMAKTYNSAVESLQSIRAVANASIVDEEKRDAAVTHISLPAPRPLPMPGDVQARHRRTLSAPVATGNPGTLSSQSLFSSSAAVTASSADQPAVAVNLSPQHSG